MGTVVSLFGIEPIRVGGVERLCRETSLQLGERGWRHVIVFAAPPIPQVAEYLQLPNVTIESVPGLEYAHFGKMFAVARLFAQYKPDIIHLHFLGFIGPYPLLSRGFGASKAFITDHGSRPSDFVPRRAAAWKRLAAGILNIPVTSVFGVSDYNRRTLEASGYLDEAKFQRLYESIYLPDLEDAAERGAAFRHRYQIPDDRELVVQVSWVIPEKGIPDFLQAARLVVSERPRTHFAVVGSGKYLDEYRREAVSMGLSGKLTWTGLVENPVEEGVYAAADVFCLASRWNEAFGWVLAEAMSFERPVVGTRMGGIPEIIDEGITGYLVPSQSPRDLADRVLSLLGDPAKRKQMGKAARAVVAERFDLRQTVAALLRHYEV
jgi:glycosyltransferase involved in cell wall biosynthesis